MKSFYYNVLKVKKRVVSTLFLYSLIFILSCDFESPEKWETPTWYIPLTFPLIDNEYTFEGMVDSAIIVADSFTNVIQIEFSSDIPGEDADPLGIPDSLFNITLSEASFDLSAAGFDDPVTIPVSPIMGVPIPINIPTPSLPGGITCLPVTLISQLLTGLDPVSGTVPLDVNLSNTASSIDPRSLTIDQGLWNMTVVNNLPFMISSVDFELKNTSNILFSTDNLMDIKPYETSSNPQQISTSSPSVIFIQESLEFLVDIIIDENQNGEDECVDADNLSTSIVYICGTDDAIDSRYYTDSQNRCKDECNTSIACNEVYYCDSNPVDTYIDSNCLQRTDSNPNVFGCLGQCMKGSSVSGWAIEETSQGDGLYITFEYAFDRIASVGVYLDIPSETISMGQEFPGFESISIQSAKVNSSTEDYPNTISIGMTNNLFADFSMKFDFLNFFNEQTGLSLSETITVSPGQSTLQDINFSEYILAESYPASTSLDSMKFNIQTIIESGLYQIPVVNDEISIGFPQLDLIEMESLSLEYISAITNNLGFPEIPSPPIEGIPDGFSGFEFYDIILEMEFFNEIGINVILDMSLKGTKEDILQEKLVTINPVVGAPSGMNYGCNFNTVGDTARTVIRINRDGQKTEYYCSPNQIDPSCVCPDDGIACCPDVENSDDSIIDLMNFAPDQIEVSGSVNIDGQGFLAPGSNIWGSFKLVAPLGFIFTNPINIIPSSPTVLAPMGTSIAEQIDTALVEAGLNIVIDNSSALGGSFGLLVSDSTIFPLFLDSLITGEWSSQNSEHVNRWQTFWDSFDTPINIDYIVSENTSEDLEIKFYDCGGNCNVLDSMPDQDPSFFIGRLFNLQFPRSDSIEYNLGYVNPEFNQITESDLTINKKSLSWIFTDEQRYTTPIISFDSNPLQVINEDGSSDYKPVTFQTTNYIGVQAYFTLILNVGALGRENN